MARKTLLGLAALLLVAGCGGSRGFGIGFVVGEPDGLALKGWLDDRSSVNAAFSWPKGAFHCQVDYAYHGFDAIRADYGEFGLYLGIGARGTFIDGTATDVFGIRFPLGLTYIIEDEWLDIFVEIIPSLTVAPDSDFDFSGAFGMHIFIR